MSIEFMQLTSTHDTPIFVRKDVVLYIEGFTFPDTQHIGTRLTLLAGGWTESIVCKEKPVQVFKRLVAEN